VQSQNQLNCQAQQSVSTAVADSRSMSAQLSSLTLSSDEGNKQDSFTLSEELDSFFKQTLSDPVS